MEKTAGKRRWLVLAGGVLIQLFGGIPAAWGAFQKGVEQGFSLDTNAVVLVFSFVIAAFGVGCVAGGALQDKLGARPACLLGAAGLGGGFWAGSFLPQGLAWPLYLAFSLPVGTGCALLYPAVMSCAQKWWPQKKGFATGVIGGAVGLSGAVLTFSARWLVGNWGIRVCFRVLGSVMAAVCVLGALVLREPPTAPAEEGQKRPPAKAAKGGTKAAKGGIKAAKAPHAAMAQKRAPEDAANGQAATGAASARAPQDMLAKRAAQGTSPKAPAKATAAKRAPKGATDLPPGQVVRTADYWLLLTAVACAAPTVLLFSPVILQLGQQRGLSEQTAALAIVVGSLTSAAGRLGMPWLSDRIGRRAADLILFGALGAFSVVFGFVQGVWVIVLYACLTFCYSGQAALLPSFASDRYGPRWAGVNYGLLALGMSVGSVAFPLLARTLQGETVPHWIAAVAAAVGFVCLLFYGRGQGQKD